MWVQAVNDLRKEYSSPSVEYLCLLFGHSKQAYYKSLKKIQRDLLSEESVLEEVDKMRHDMPRLGVRKIHSLLLLLGFTIGRDALFGLLRRHGYLLRQRKYKPLTTNSFHRFRVYENLIRDKLPLAAHQIYVSDITYIRLSDGSFRYLSLVTDTYSRKIVGWCLFDSLQTEGPLAALQMALAELPEQHELIHHSDRGTQYCSYNYIHRLTERGIGISMTQSGDPLENAIAERVNGILKMEWLNEMEFPSMAIARQKIEKVIELYNHKRPHSSVEMMTPVQAHLKTGPLKRAWKNYYTPIPVQTAGRER